MTNNSVSDCCLYIHPKVNLNTSRTSIGLPYNYNETESAKPRSFDGHIISTISHREASSSAVESCITYIHVDTVDSLRTAVGHDLLTRKALTGPPPQHSWFSHCAKIMQSFCCIRVSNSLSPEASASFGDLEWCHRAVAEININLSLKKLEAIDDV